MSMMCKMGEACSHAKGVCGHEKMMLVVGIMGAVVAIAHWGLHLF